MANHLVFRIQRTSPRAVRRNGLKEHLCVVDCPIFDLDPFSSNMVMQSENTETSDNDWVRITSADGFSFVVRRNIAQASGTMKAMLDVESSYAEATTGTCPSGQRAIIAEKLVEYMSFKSHYETVGPKEDIPLHEFMERIPREVVLELLLAADYHEM